MVDEKVVKKLNEEMLCYFEKFSNVYPRGSKKERAAAEFLIAFATEKGLNYEYQKETIEGTPVSNVVIKKQGTQGYEEEATVVLQAHMDMVCEKSLQSAHDFDNEPIHIVKTTQTYTTADKTTLGADDGIGVAYAMALLASDEIVHPPLEAVFTSDEEDGMSGAKYLDTRMLTGKKLINIDSEDEGLFFYGCAGGIYAKSKFLIQYEDAPAEAEFLKISMNGLTGGHSGSDIHAKRANANRLMGRLLYSILMQESEFRLAHIDGGSFTNAIASKCEAIIATTNKERILQQINKMIKVFGHEYKEIEKTMEIFITSEKRQPVLLAETSKGIVATLFLVPNDVIAMSSTIENLVETSSNIGLVKKEEDAYVITSFIRSSVASRKYYVAEQMRCLASFTGAAFSMDTDCPEWEPNPDSSLLELFEQTYQEVFNKLPQKEAIHAGLECGYFLHHYPDMDMISIGPTLTGAHTPEETLYVETTPKVMALLLNVLEKMK